MRDSPPCPQGAKRPCPFPMQSYTLAGYINAGTWLPHAMTGARTQSIKQRQTVRPGLRCYTYRLRCTACKSLRERVRPNCRYRGTPRERCCDSPALPFLCFWVSALLSRLSFTKSWVKRTGVPVSSQLYSGKWPPADERLCTALVLLAPYGPGRSLGFHFTSTVVGRRVLVLSSGWLASYVGQSEVPASTTTVFFFKLTVTVLCVYINNLCNHFTLWHL